MKTIGIIGGMGPLATVDLFNKIVNMTQVEKESDHIHILIDNNPHIPDRTAFIIDAGESPQSELNAAAKRLENAGADFLIMACNTAHYFASDIKKEINIPFLSMIEATAKTLEGIKKVGLLATKGTYEGQVYSNVFDEYGIEIINPSDEIKTKSMEMIYALKAGVEAFDENELNFIIKHFEDNGASKVILGCTELPIIFKDYKHQEKIIDPTSILANSAIKYAKEL